MFNGSLMTVFWYLLMLYVFFMVIWMFVMVFGDILHRKDMSGWGKFGWLILIFFLPLLGVLVYVATRPKDLG